MTLLLCHPGPGAGIQDDSFWTPDPTVIKVSVGKQVRGDRCRTSME